MHALLGLAATCLTFACDADYSALAIYHRLLAIQGLNEALSTTPWTSDEGDALLAACYALAFQSYFMKDGMYEYLTMVRGCGLVSLQLLDDNVDVSFSTSLNEHWEFMQSRLDNLPSIDTSLLEGSSSSLDAILPLCKESDTHIFFSQSTTKLRSKNQRRCSSR